MTDSSKSASDGIQEVQIDLETKFSKNVYKATWRVTNFALCQYKNGEFIDSNSFSTNFEDKKKDWYLKMYPFGMNAEHTGYVSLFLYCKTECCACYELKLLNQRNVAQCEVTGKDSQFNGNNGWGSHRFVKREQLFEENSKLLVDGAMKILCVITMIEMGTVRQPKRAGSRTTRQLSKDLGDLFKSSRLSDVTITAGGRKFNVHRAILAARSPVFSAMFDHDMTENSSGMIDIPDISAQAMEALLYFMYTGDCPDVRNVAEDLFQISEKYQLDELKEICSNDLFDQISCDNAASILVLADFCNAQDLKENVLQYVTSNLEAVSLSEGWKNMTVTNPRLSVEVQSTIIERKVLKKSD